VLIGELYRCQNPDCRSEIRVSKSSIEASLNPRCACGAEMKKPYVKPALRELAESTIGFFSTSETFRKRQN
jgi:hypothetical protein